MAGEKNGGSLAVIVTHVSALHVGMARKKKIAAPINVLVSSYTAITRPGLRVQHL